MGTLPFFFAFFPQVGYSNLRILFRRQVTHAVSTIIISCVCHIPSQECDHHMLVTCEAQGHHPRLNATDCRFRSGTEVVSGTCDAAQLPLPLPLAEVKVTTGAGSWDGCQKAGCAAGRGVGGHPPWGKKSDEGNKLGYQSWGWQL